MWFDKDEFHYLWRKASGDLSISADIEILPSDLGANAHRKGVLMIRSGLDTNSAYVSVALHGNGLTSLQYRYENGGLTSEVQTSVSGPHRLRLEKVGDSVWMSIAGEGEELRSAGSSAKVKLEGELYIGLGVCAHEKDRTETVRFSNVVLTQGTEMKYGEEGVESTLERIDMSSVAFDRRAIYTTNKRFEAPNWSMDNKLYFNMEGEIYVISADGGEPVKLDMGFANRANNDHGISPDGKTFIISDQSQLGGGSRIYTLPIEGGTPKLITPEAPAYWHGVSPDGQTLVYVGQEAGVNDYDIFTVPIDGGPRTRITSATGLDDGPDYSPDGQFIWFNSMRTGTMQIWKMKADGSDQTQMTFDESNDWFPHPSPDGKWIVFVSYEAEVEGHPAYKDVTLRLMPTEGGEPKVMARLFGGQGTINVPSWSPDSKHFAFVSHRLTKE